MTRNSLRSLCLITTAIVSLALAAPAEAKDKPKCCIIVCPPVPQCVQMKGFGVTNFERQCATELVFQGTDPFGTVFYGYDGFVCPACESPTFLVFGAEPATLGCTYNPGYCDDPGGEHCILVPTFDLHGKTTRVNNAVAHKGIPSKAITKLDKAGDFDFDPKTVNKKYKVKSDKGEIVKFETTDHNNKKVTIVAVLKTFTVQKEGAKDRVVRMGIELTEKNGNGLTALNNPEITKTGGHSLVLRTQRGDWVVTTQTILKP